jgi:hypothetical protein
MLVVRAEERRRLVRAMAGSGVRRDDIAAHLGIDPKTLRKHFRRELDRGAVEANANVAQSLFNMATQGNNVAAAIFWMKARAGWREKHDLELTGKNGVPLAPPRPPPLTVTFARPGDRLLDTQPPGPPVIEQIGRRRVDRCSARALSAACSPPTNDRTVLGGEQGRRSRA